MAVSDAMRYRLGTGGSAEDLYATIRDFLSSSPDANATQAAMVQYGISGEDVANATGGASGGLLGGNILAGASWNSLNTTLGDELTAATGQQTSNYAVGGATTADTLNQLNTYLAGGGQFDSNATVFLQTGGVDFLQGVDKGTIKDNINQIVKTLGDQGVNVVLTGSPYAASIDDVINNNFDPVVDPIFTEIAKENKNVALVGVQGEILQNKALLVDALHTNAEGTAVYNQAVIDSLSQFKNEVPLSTPEVIAQVQTSNVVATAPAQITQLAQTGQNMPVIPTTRGKVIEGDNIEQQIAGVPQVVYETRVDPNNTANWQTFNPKTGEVIDSGTFAGGGSKGLLEASRPVLALVASVLGAPYLSNLIAGSTGLTGSALAGATGATIAGGSTALTGGSAEDTLKAALLGGGGGYLGNELNSYLNTAGGAVLGDASDIAMQMADAGKTLTEIETTLTNSGFSADVVADSLKDAANTLAPKAINIPSTVSGLTDAVNVVGQSAAPSLSNVLSTIASTAPVAFSTPVSDTGTVNIETARTPQAVDQRVIDLVNSQIASNVSAPTNLANVQVSAPKTTTTQDVINAIAATIPAVTAVPAPASTPAIPTQTVVADRPVSIGDTLAAITTIPSTLNPTPVTATPTTPTKETDPLRVAQLALAAAGLLGAGSALSSSGTPTGFDIVPIPETFLTPPKPTVAPFTALPPINFGDRNLLRGTQWEKFLNPNYGKVPEPIKYSQPSSLSYNDLMGILGSRQGMPARSNLSINDIISGIQNQYGQAPTSTVG